ncbi:MAG: G-D-S-L family lipolytic protein [Proteobacteria bacterium]|nr:G-D-S-L family lipolytic protein [Pseudomonadota bacterium]
MSACSSDVSNPPPLNSGTPSSGDADFTTFVSIGDSLTAGYADGSLYLLGQQNSFPLMLAQQFAAADGVAASFEQPLLAHDLLLGTDGNLGGLLVGATPGLIENRFVLNTETEAPERLEGAPTNDVIGTGLNGMTFNNMGVPGAKSFHLGAPGYGNPANLPAAANPYFIRFASVSPTATVIGDAAAQAPSFYTLWIGNNDVLGYAASGGTGADSCNPLGGPCGSNDITDPVAFAGVYAQLVGAFTAANPAVQGVLINIADVSTLPYFTTVPYNAVPLEQADADQLNEAYAAYNAGLAAAMGLGLIDEYEVALRTINFVEGQNAVLIDTINNPGDMTDLTGTAVPLSSWRHAKGNDLIVLPAAATIQAGGGTMVPLADADVLISLEINAVNVARKAYNATIKDTADNDPNLVFLDAAALIKQLNDSGIDYGNGSIKADFVTGGAFSLDGIHPTARGYAVTANEIINVINTGFNANVHKVDPATYPTVFLK